MCFIKPRKIASVFKSTGIQSIQEQTLHKPLYECNAFKGSNSATLFKPKLTMLIKILQLNKTPI